MKTASNTLLVYHISFPGAMVFWGKIAGRKQFPNFMRTALSCCQSAKGGNGR